LRVLKARRCSLRFGPVSLPTSLVDLDLSINPLVRANLVFTQLVNLTELRVTNSSICHPPCLPKSLRTLYLRGSYFRGVTLPFAHLTELRELHLADCSLDLEQSSLPPSIEKLNMSHSNFGSVVLNLAHMCRLHDLWLEHCNLREMPHLSASVRRLWMRNNNFTLTRLEFSHLTALEWLDLASCRLVWTPTSIPGSLEKMSLLDNNLREVPLRIDHLTMTADPLGIIPTCEYKRSTF
jgi:Leucine-rich repeat (LRR) protein